MSTGMIRVNRVLASDVRRRPFARGAGVGAVVLVAAACAGNPGRDAVASGPSPSDGPRVVQAGAPGEASRAFGGGSLDEVQGIAFTRADVAFIQGMIHHHAQALEMTALIPERTTGKAIRQMGLRMEISQKDEIGIMERWLRARGLEVPEWHRGGGAGQGQERGATGHGTTDHPVEAHSAGHGTTGHAAGGHTAPEHGATEHAAPAPPTSDRGDMDHRAHGHGMPGMLTPLQMAQLEAARGVAFDRLFLELMIQHHQGALAMVRDLYNSPGAAQESLVYQLASEIDADQDIEIRRMREILQTLR